MGNKVKYLVSACLCGIRSRFDGKDARDNQIAELVKKGEAIPVCPEELGGLPVPRPPGEIEKGDDKDVLSEQTKVVSKDGEDLTPFFLRGAFASITIAKKFKVKKAMLKQNSPSCGCGWIKRKGKLVKGDGVTVALLKKEGIWVVPR
ncbi:MAG: hypothetical protein AMJ89_01940 [candidate division Zixibacteria bacterium SM23_73]|nr:MAG: hypothetical protein AMJ89_01940 [candidate division Zixibacteria bacterium SM23_73]